MRWLEFYDIMNYPVPHHSNLYIYLNKTDEKSPEQSNHDTIFSTVWTVFSRKQKNPLMDEYIQILHKRWRLFRMIPFVSQVYLCNSITFNALHANSDIDICIISKPWFLRFARIWSRLFFNLYRLQRSSGKHTANQSGKFCLSFYIDGDHMDISYLRNPQWDVYLSYRLAHCVLYYTDEIYTDNQWFAQNKKLLSYLPNHPLDQTIDIGSPIIRWKHRFKNSIEYIFNNKVWIAIQSVLQHLRISIISIKKNNLWPYTREHIITSSSMLKFHTDKREIIHQRRKTSHQK